MNEFGTMLVMTSGCIIGCLLQHLRISDLNAQMKHLRRTKANKEARKR